MKQKLMYMLIKMKPLMDKAMSVSPMLVGVAIGYLGHSVIKLGVDIAVKMIHMVIG